MNFYGISKFTAKITKESLEPYSTESMAIQITPGVLFLPTRGPWPVVREGRGVDRPKSGKEAHRRLGKSGGEAPRHREELVGGFGWSWDDR